MYEEHKQQKFISDNAGGWKVQGQDANMVSSWKELSLPGL